MFADDSSTDSLMLSAQQLLAAGNGAAAEVACRRVLAQRAEHASALQALGLALNLQGRAAEAAEVCLALTRLQPLEPGHWVNLGTTRRAAGDLEGALAAYMKAASLGERSADFYLNVGLAHLERRDYQAACAVLARAAALAPDDAEVRYHLAKAHYEALRPEEARTVLAGWEGWRNLGTRSLANIALLLTSLGEPRDAQAALERALQDSAREPDVTLTLVQALERTNRVTEAAALLKMLDGRAVAGVTATDLTVAKAIVAQRENRHEAACALFREALRACDSFDRRHYQLFPLAKSLDALGRYDEAFETLSAAHRSYRAHLELVSPLLALRGPTPLLTAYVGCAAHDAARWDTNDSPGVADSPIFLVGFPRSGTTLLELALDAHPSLQSMDEQPFLQAALADLDAAGGDYPRGLGGLSPAQLADVRTKYWQRVQRRVQLAPGQRLVDKNPMNMAGLPAIVRLFPNAPILLAVRHPCDVVLSCFMQHFRAPDFALLCGDLGTLARAHRGVFDFWYEQAQLLNATYAEVRYEALVADFGHEMRRILEFLGLPWCDAVLAPARGAHRKSFISTPSYAQVIRPVNTASIGRWKPYAGYFTPVLPELEKYLLQWGYSAEEARAGGFAALRSARDREDSQ